MFSTNDLAIEKLVNKLCRWAKSWDQYSWWSAVPWKLGNCYLCTEISERRTIFYTLQGKDFSIEGAVVPGHLLFSKTKQMPMHNSALY